MGEISLPFGTARTISFPLGRPPKGTCEFATEQCLRECGNRMPNFKTEQNAYKLFNKLYPDDIVDKLKDEISTASNKVLSWFPESGDCPHLKTGKVLEVMRGLDVPQNGFTRNKELWAISHNISNVHMVLTVEDEGRANLLKEQGFVAVPDYYERRVKILNKDQIWLCGGGSVTCGCGAVEDEDKVTEEDCGTCWKLLRGCYAA